MCFVWSRELANFNGTPRYITYGYPQIDGNTFRHFLLPMKRGILQKHTVRMIQTSGQNITSELFQQLGIIALPKDTSVIIPSGAGVEVSTDNIELIVDNGKVYVTRWTMPGIPPTNAILASENILVEVIEK